MVVTVVTAMTTLSLNVSFISTAATNSPPKIGIKIIRNGSIVVPPCFYGLIIINSLLVQFFLLMQIS